ncbi:MAG: GNAT family N-acetyltransferase [Deltaproteobacteria bacterium]|nr:GNAT family N-acetyltransferase [Deltaproteobacteria bacterium]
MSVNKSSYRIRFARPEEIPAITELMRPYNMHHIPSPEMGPLDYKCFIVAEQNGRLLGAAGYTFLSDDVGKTTLMAVRPDCTRLGLGRKLQTRRMQILRSLGCVKIITNADRPETIAWYKQHFGYREIGKLPKIHSFGLDDVPEWTTLEADLTAIDLPSSSRQKILINAALTGMKPRRSDNSFLPVTPAEIAKAALEAGELGASIIHLHAREANEAPTPDPAIYAEIIGRIREKNPDLIICVTTSGRNWHELEKRAAVLELPGDLKPDMASLTMGSMNFPTQASVNPPQVIQSLADRMLARNIKPELEIFEVGMLDYAKYLIRKGFLRQPVYFNLILGSLGTMSASPDNLRYLVSQLPAFSPWAASGIGRFHGKVQELTAAMGGGIRTGLEDSLYLDINKQIPASNSDWIRKAVDAARRSGREVATASDVRQWLELDTP